MTDAFKMQSNFWSINFNNFHQILKRHNSEIVNDKSCIKPRNFMQFVASKVLSFIINQNIVEINQQSKIRLINKQMEEVIRVQWKILVKF
jgi:hypothetical protein